MTNIALKLYRAIERDGTVHTAKRAIDAVFFRDRPTQKKKLPSFLIETVTVCNLRCPMCARTVNVEKKNWKNSVMSLGTFKAIAENLPQTDKLSLHGLGEPTLNPDFIKIVEYAKRSGKFSRIHTVTNAVAKGPDYYDDLFDAGMTDITISIDSLVQPIADKTRTGTDVEELIRNTETILSRHPGKVSINTVVGYINFPTTRDTLNRMNDFAFRALGGNGQLVVKIMRYGDWGNDDQVFEDGDSDNLSTLFSEAESWWPSLKLRDGFSTDIEWHQCSWPKTSNAIYFDGTLVPCCNAMNREGSREAFGNVNMKDTPYVDAVQSSAVKDFHRSFQRKKPSFCDGCPVVKP